MPRRSKGARLQLKAERRDKRGNITHRATWIIRDSGRDVFTGCPAEEIGAAEQKLTRYLAEKYSPRRKVQDIETIPVGDVLSIFVDDRREKQRNKKGFDKRIGRLNAWWGAKILCEVTGENCRAYEKARGSRGGARRDLEDLRAAINHHAKEGLHRGVVRVALPEKGEARDRWLTRDEAAALLWACWRAREVQTMRSGLMKGQKVATSKRPLRHLARFILIGLYSGSRAGAIAAASPIPAIGRSYVDLEQGIFYRLPQGQRRSNKRQPPMPIPRRLLAHLRRWKERGLCAAHFVEFNGKPVASVKTAFKSAVKLARLARPASPHTLRHTAATWLMQRRAPIWEAAGYLGMSPKVLQDTYGHPDHLQNAVEAIDRKTEQKRGVSGAVTGAVTPFRKIEK